jgi:hypothetical protein
VSLEPVGDRDGRNRRGAVTAGLTVAALLALVVGLAVIPASVAPTRLETASPPASDGAVSSPPILEPDTDLSFVTPRGTVVVDRTTRPTGGTSRYVTVPVGTLAPGPHHWGIVGRCVGPGSVAWQIGPPRASGAQAGEIPCDRVAHGTGTITDARAGLPVSLAYDSGAAFRFVVVLIGG